MDRDALCLVTGGRGFVGARLVAALRARGQPVRLTSSRPGTASAEVVQADLGDPDALARAAEGCNTIFHVAYAFGRDGGDEHRLNVDGTMALARAAQAQGVRRFVHVGSVAAYGRQPPGDLDETNTPRPEDAYARIKHEIDTRLLGLHRATGFPVAIVQPVVVYGPDGGTWTREPLRQIKAGKVALPANGEGVCNAVYVDDVVAALLLAAERPEAIGEVFLVGGPAPVTWGAFYAAYAAMAGVASVTLMDEATLDAALARRYGTIASLQRYRRGLEKVLSRLGLGPREALWLPNPAVRELYAAQTRVRIDKARRLLGYAPEIDLARGMALTADWARTQGLI